MVINYSSPFLSVKNGVYSGNYIQNPRFIAKNGVYSDKYQAISEYGMFPRLRDFSHKHSFFLFGPRGTGKSTLLKKEIQSKPMPLAGSFRFIC